MKTVSISYPHDEVLISSRLETFFEITGLHVISNYFYDATSKHIPVVNMTENIQDIENKFKDVKSERSSIEPDINISILINYTKDKFLQIQKFFKNNTIVVTDNATASIISSYKKKETILPIDTTDDTNFYSVLYSIFKIINNWNIIDKNEYDEYSRLIDLYTSNNGIIEKVLIEGKLARAEDIDDQQLIEWKREIWNAVQQSIPEYPTSEEEEFYKTSQLEIIKYAILYIQYCMVFFNKRARVYKVDTIAKFAELLFKNSQNNNIKISTAVLLGNIYTKLLHEANKGYYYYTDIINDLDIEYARNSYILYLIKGEYWNNFVGDYDRANKYYFKSILTNPEFYRAWYKLGYDFYRVGDTNEAITTFRGLIKLLSIKVKTKSIKPLEARLYAHACKLSAKLYWLKYVNTDMQAECISKIEELSRVLNELTFWNLVSDETKNIAIQEIRSVINK